MTYEILFRIYRGLSLFLDIISYVLIIYALMTWFVRPDSTVYRLFARFCQPLLSPFRGIAGKLMEKGLMIDISVYLALIAIRLIRSLLYQLLLRL